MGLFYLAQHPDSPRTVWIKHHEHMANSQFAKEQKQKLFVKLNGLQIRDHPSRINFLTEWSHIQAEIDALSLNPMDDAVKSDILQVAIKCDPMMVTTFSNFEQLCAMQNLPAAIPFPELFQ